MVLSTKRVNQMANTFKVMMVLTVEDNNLLPGNEIIDAIDDYLTQNNINGTIDTLHLTKIAPHCVDAQINAINESSLELLAA
jgi:hypothetical protein